MKTTYCYVRGFILSFRSYKTVLPQCKYNECQLIKIIALFMIDFFLLKKQKETFTNNQKSDNICINFIGIQKQEEKFSVVYNVIFKGLSTHSGR